MQVECLTVVETLGKQEWIGDNHSEQTCRADAEFALGSAAINDPMGTGMATILADVADSPAEYLTPVETLAEQEPCMPARNIETVSNHSAIIGRRYGDLTTIVDQMLTTQRSTLTAGNMQDGHDLSAAATKEGDSKL